MSSAYVSHHARLQTDPRRLAPGRDGLGAGILSREAPRSPEQTDLRFLDSKDIPSFKQGLDYKLKNDKM